MEKDKKKDIITYENHINTVHLHGFNAKDRDLFMIICKSLINKDTFEIKVDYRDLMNLGDFKGMNLEEFHSSLKKLTPKFYSLFFSVDTDDEFFSVGLFRTFSANRQKRTLTVKIDEECTKLFNLQENALFTSVDLVKYLSFQSKHTKTLYQYLMQFKPKRNKTNAWWIVSVEDFIDIFDLGYCYQKTKKRIKDDVINPSINELKPYLDIKCETIRGTGKGRPVVAYKFEYSVKNQKIDNKKVEEQEDKEDEEESLFDKIIDLLDNAQLGIGTRSIMSCAKKAVELNRDITYIEDVINIVKSQSSDNVAGKLMYLIVNGYDKPKKSNKFNTFEQRKADITDDFEKKLLENNL